MKKVIPVVLIFTPLLVIPPACKASIMARLCSSFENVLDDEAAKADAAVKSCKKNCAVIQKKHDLIEAAQKKVNDSCSKGITPDVTKVSAGLDKNVKAKLSKLYNQHSKMYDGTADLPAKDFGLTTKSNQSPVLTGRGGQVADLKMSDPDIKKLSPVTEFGLSGTKSSGETPGQAATKQSSSLLELASSAKASANTLLASAKTVLSTQKASAAVSTANNYDDPTLYNQACIQAARTLCTLWGTAPLDQACLDREAVSCKISGGCPPGQVQIGTGCGCTPGTGQVLIGGKCACREGSGQVIDPTTEKCGCPVDTGQVLNPEGKCVCAPDYIFTIAKKCEPKNSDNGRHLTIDEMLAAQKIFGDKIPDSVYKQIKLVTTGMGDSSHLSTFGYTIYIPGYQDFIPGNQPDYTHAALMHELTHVYQKQNWKYWPTKIVDFFLQIGMSTEKKYSFGTLTGKESFGDYRLEQQAAIIQAYYYGTRMYDHQQPLTDNEKTIIENMLCGQGLLSKGVCDAAAQKKI